MIVVDASAVLETLPAGIYDKGNGLSGQFALQKIMRHTCRLYRQRDDKHHRAEQGRRQSGRQEWQGQEPVERKPDDHRERPSKRRPNDDLRGIYRAIHRGTLNPRSLSISPCRLLRFRPTVRLGSGATELKVSITSPLIPHLQRSEPDQKSFDYVAAVDTGCRTLQSLFFVCAISGNDNAAPTVAMSRAAVGCHGE